MAVSINGSQALSWVAGLDDDPMKAAVKRIENQFKGLGSTVQKETASIDSLVQKTTSAIAAYATFAAAGNFIKDIVAVRGQFQQLSTSFEVMLGSKEKADELLRQGVTLAAKTPFTLAEVGAGAKQLLAYGFAADKITDNLTMLGNVASGVGAPLGDLVYLYGTLRSTGKATQIDLQQFAGRGIPIYEALAKVLNITSNESKSATQQIRELVSAGKIGFGDVEKAFTSLTSTGGQFFNLMEEQSKTLTGLTSNLEDAWQRMLNEIGKGNEGLLTSAIKGATALVNNYQEVLKVLEVLVITYGSYRAAIIATNVVQAISTSLTKGYTIAEILRYQAMLLSERAMKLLNLTMLSNPAVAITTGIAALVAALVIFTNQADDASKAQLKLNQINGEAEKQIVSEKRHLEELLTIARDETRSKEDREKAIRKINAISPEYLGNLTLENVRTQQGIEIINKYIGALERKSKAQAAENALQDVDRRKLEAQLNAQKQIDFTPKTATKGEREGILAEANRNLKEETETLEREADLIKKTYKSVLEESVLTDDAKVKSKKRGVTAIEDEIKALREQQGLEATTHAESLKFETQIRKLEQEANAIRGTTRKQEEVAENKQAAILEKRKSILEDIAALQRESTQSGLIKEQSEIDKVNEKYENLFKTITEFNTSNNPKVGQSAINALKKAQAAQVGNLGLKADAEEFKKKLERQKGLFVEFEDAKKQIGIEKAKEMYAQQIKGFDSYLKFLDSEAETILPKIFSGTANIGDEEKLIAIAKGRGQAVEAENKRQIEKQKEDYLALLDASKSFQLQRIDVEKKYNSLYATLSNERGRISVSEYEERLKQLQVAKKEELDLITRNELEKSDAYKAFQKGFSNIGIVATEGILKGLKNLRDQMKGMGKDISEVNKAVDTASLALNQKSVSGIRDASNLLRNAFKDLNIQVAGQLKITAAQISDALDNVATLLSKDSSTGDQIGSIIGLANFVITSISDALKSAKDLEDPLKAQKDYYADISAQISASNDLLTRQKAILSEIIGIQRTERALKYLDDLQKKKELTLKALQDLKIGVIESQKEVFRLFGADVPAKGLLGLYVKLQTAGIAKKSLKLDLGSIDTNQLSTIEDFVNLLNEIKLGGGKLNGKTIIDEDIKSLQLLIETYDKTVAEQKEFKQQLDQILTGTAVSAISDSIVDGFRNGLRSAQDFAKTFEDLMKNAVLNSIKFQTLEGPLREFYDQFAKFSATDDVLTEDEIRKLRGNFNDILSTAEKKFNDLQKITNLDFATASQAGNSLIGNAKALSEETGSVLAGQLGAMRITAGDQLLIAGQQLNVLNAIQSNTAFIQSMYQLWQRMELNGIKIKP